MHYYIIFNNNTVGPMTKEQLFSYDVNENTQVSANGTAWAPLYSFPDLMQMLQNKRQFMNGNNNLNNEVNSKKTLCGIMAIIFGTLGVQYFILGKVGGGFVTILISIVTCGLWGVVMLIQGIMMLSMSDADFKRKYMDSSSFMPLF